MKEIGVPFSWSNCHHTFMYWIVNKRNKLTKSYYFSMVMIIITMSMLFFSSLIVTSHAQSTKPFPVLLIHGYNSTAKVWKEWGLLLNNSHIPYKAVTFTQDDKCGSAKDHADELQKIVSKFKKDMGAKKINIVAHSKGGLDTRIYLKNNMTNDSVANFIMIGTPNKGSPVEDRFYLLDDCRPAASDLLTSSDIAISTDQEKRNNHTSYYTIAGIWEHNFLPNSPIDINCPEPDFNWLTAQYVGKSLINGSSDGLVPLSSSEIHDNYRSLGNTDNCHTQLLDYESFELAKGILNK